MVSYSFIKYVFLIYYFFKYLHNEGRWKLCPAYHWIGDAFLCAVHGAPQAITFFFLNSFQKVQMYYDDRSKNMPLKK